MAVAELDAELGFVPDTGDDFGFIPDPPAEPKARQRAALLEQRTKTQKENTRVDTRMSAIGVAEEISQANPITVLPRLAFELDRKLGFVPDTQENPIDANKPLLSPSQIRGGIDFFTSETREPGTTTEAVKEFSSDFLSGLTSPNMLNPFLLGKVKGLAKVAEQVKATLGPAFAAYVSSHAPEAYQDYLHAVEGGDGQEITKAALNLTAAVAIPGSIIFHAAKGKGAPLFSDKLDKDYKAALESHAKTQALEATLPLTGKTVLETGGQSEAPPRGYYFGQTPGAPPEHTEPLQQAIKGEVPPETKVLAPATARAFEETVGATKTFAEKPPPLPSSSTTPTPAEPVSAPLAAAAAKAQETPPAPELVPAQEAPVSAGAKAEEATSYRQQQIDWGLENLPFGKTAQVEMGEGSSKAMSALGYGIPSVSRRLKIISGEEPYPSKEEFLKGVDSNYIFDALGLRQKILNALSNLGLDTRKANLPVLEDFDTPGDYYQAMASLEQRMRREGMSLASALVETKQIPKPFTKQDFAAPVSAAEKPVEAAVKPAQVAPDRTTIIEPDVSPPTDTLKGKQGVPKQLKAQREYLLSALDSAIKEAPEEAQPAPELAAHLKQVETALSPAPYGKDPDYGAALAQLGPQLEAFGMEGWRIQQKGGGGWQTMDPAKKADVVKPLEKEPTPSQVYDELKRRAKEAVERSNQIRIEIPGDGEFTIQNNQAALKRFREIAAKNFPKGEGKMSVPSTAPKGTTGLPPIKAPSTIKEQAGVTEAFASTDAARFAITKPWAVGDRLVATDGRRLIVIEGKFPGSKEKPAYIDPATGKVIPHTPPEGVEGKTPDFEQVIPKDRGQIAAGVSTEDLFRWTRQALGVVRKDKDTSPTLTLWIDRKGQIGVSARSPELGEYRSSENVESGKVVVHLNAEYLLDAVTAARKLGAETVDLFTGAADDVALAPIVIKGKGFEVVQMPMRGGGLGPTLTRKDFKGGKFKWRDVKESQELSQTSKPTDDPFERARAGDETAWEDLHRQFRETYPEEEQQGDLLSTGGRHRVLTAEAFERLFNDAYRDRDFDRILTAVKASDLAVYKPLIQKFFKAQKTDPIAAAKAEWMRAVFNGTRPVDAKPPKAPSAAPPPQPTSPPQPQPGAQPGGSQGPGVPPPGSQAPPPAPPPPRIPVAPIPGGGAKAPSVILEDFARAIGKAIRVRRQRPGTLGTYAPSSTLTTERFAGDLDTAAHELAGHWVDDKYGIAKPWFKSHTRSPYDTELAKFWIHGSATPSMALRYKRAEGIAEFARAYVMNPAEAMREAPLFGAYFERTLPPEALKAVRDFSNDVRRWAGEDPLRAGGLDIRMEPPTLRERLWRALRGRGFGFETSPVDALREKFDDPYHYAVKSFHEAAEARGKNTPLTLLPEENFELAARLLATHDDRMLNQLEFGLVPLKPRQVQGPKEMEVVRLKDPVTGKPMTLEWLNDAFDTSRVKTIQADQLDTASYMIAQRTLAKAQQTGKESGISGAGHGIYTDVNRARELLARVAADPALEAKLKEGAWRYRLWASTHIDMLVDSGRLSSKQAKEIRDRNEFYVDMHRLSEEFDFNFKRQRGATIGTARELIKRFKGSALEVNNVYSNLLSQTDSIQKEAHRNMVMRDYTEMLTSLRKMHQGPPIDLDKWGSRARSDDRNTIAVYRDGKAEYWKFDPDIYSSLKGLGELSTNAIWKAVTMPQQVLRYLVTHSPPFAARNVIKDTFGRTVVSRQNSLPWDILKGYTQEELSRYEIFGGGQFGNYIRDRLTWNRVLKDKMREMSDDPANIFLAPLRLWEGWSKLVRASETTGRIAEFRNAFEKGKKEYGYDDYNAALYAAGEARGLMDFAKMGTYMRHINQAVPFSNAGIRGVARDFTAAKENPTRFALRWTTAVLAPSLAVLAWNHSDPDTWQEYLQLPAYQRDMFWNFKVGRYWLRIPRTHLLGVLAGGVERALLRGGGDKRAFEGYPGSLSASALPVSDPGELTGPLKLWIEIKTNHKFFGNREIIPFYEEQLKPELRKGEKYSSGAGLGIAHVLRSAGLTTDARQVDHVLNSYGGLGQMVTSATDPKRSWWDVALQTSGLITQSPTTTARDVQWVMKWARENGQANSEKIKDLTAIRNRMFEESDPDRKQELGKQLREHASRLRASIERTK